MLHLYNKHGYLFLFPYFFSFTATLLYIINPFGLHRIFFFFFTHHSIWFHAGRLKIARLFGLISLYFGDLAFGFYFHLNGIIYWAVKKKRCSKPFVKLCIACFRCKYMKSEFYAFFHEESFCISRSARSLSREILSTPA